MSKTIFLLKLVLLGFGGYYISTLNGQVTIEWIGNYINTSMTVFAFVIVLVIYIVWKLSKLFAYSRFAPKKYFLNRDIKNQQVALQYILDGETAFANRDENLLQKTIHNLSKIIGINHDSIILMNIQMNVLLGNFDEALVLYDKAHTRTVFSRAGRVLVMGALDDEKIKDKIIDIQKRHDGLQDWAYMRLSDQQETYDDAIKILKAGVKSKQLDKITVSALKEFYADKFKAPDEIAGA